MPGVTQKSPRTLQIGLKSGSPRHEAGHALDTVVVCTHYEPEITVDPAGIKRSGACFRIGGAAQDGSGLGLPGRGTLPSEPGKTR